MQKEPIADNADANIQSFKPSSTKKYIGCKIIAAEPMNEDVFLKEVKGVSDEELKNRETQGAGYKVVYPDGYVSWSPKNVFEEAYREVSMKEYMLLHS